MQYFLDTVSYDYGYLLGVGYGQGSISRIDCRASITKNFFADESNGAPEYFIRPRIFGIEGESPIFNAIDTLETEAIQEGVPLEELLKRVKEYLKTELKKHLDND